MTSRAVSLSGMGHGLTTEKQLHINQMLVDYSGGKLSLRRIPESDPAFRYGMQLTPPKIFGVYEENVAAGQPNWVFTLAEMSIDERVLARIIENDLSRGGADAHRAKFEAFERAQQASKLKAHAEMMEEREDEMLTIGRLAAKKHTFRHRIGGEDVIIGDTIRPARRAL